MEQIKINNSVIKIVGLLEATPARSISKVEDKFTKAGFTLDKFPLDENGLKNERSIKFLQDAFYKEFREIMFLDSYSINPKRLFKKIGSQVSLIKKVKVKDDWIEKVFPVNISNVEVFLFPGQIGLFSLTIKLDQLSNTLQDLSDVLFLVRQFDSLTADGEEWHSWITKNCIAGTNLRGDNVKIDDFSGSKFKLFTVLDAEVSTKEQDQLLYELGTVSPIGSLLADQTYAPSKAYYELLMDQNTISAFNNWKVLCLFDTFTCVGQNQLQNPAAVTTWEYTYFRIYLYRLFLKFNLFRYNSDFDNDTIQIRDQFENFLNSYNISTISFNFLPNLFYDKIGKSLDLDTELASFQARINRISQAIQEEKQARTNNLLQLVSILGGITSLGPVFEILTKVKSFLGWNDIQLYSTLFIVSSSIGTGLLIYLMPDKYQKFKSWWKSKK